MSERKDNPMHPSQRPQPGQSSRPAQPGQGKPAQTTGHEVNGKHTAPGHKVHYTGHDGQQHEATIDGIEGNFADLTVHEGGAPKKFTSVPHSAVGGVHTWDHAPSK